MEINLGDTVILRKVHPCGSYEWEVLRAGMDIRLMCLSCKRQILLPRKQVEKSIKKIIKKASD